MNKKDKTVFGLRRRFTLVEMLIVFVVIGIILTLALPKMVSASRHQTIEDARLALCSAVDDAAMRSRTSGQILVLTLNEASHCFDVSIPDDDNVLKALNRHWQPPADSALLEARTASRSAIIQAKPSYPFPEQIVWNIAQDSLDEDGNAVIVFFPDGQAAGRPLDFTLQNAAFQLTIDRVTATPNIKQKDTP